MNAPRVHLHHGDWREFVALWPTPCVLVTDPPFGIRHRLTDSHTWRGGKDAGFVHQPRAWLFEPGDAPPQCSECGSTELRIDPTDGSTDCVACGANESRGAYV